MEMRVLLLRIQTFVLLARIWLLDGCSSPFCASQQASIRFITKVTLPMRLPSIEHELRFILSNERPSPMPVPYATLLPRKPCAIATSFSASTLILPALLPFAAIFSLRCHLFRIKLRHPHERFKRIQRVIPFANAQSALSHPHETTTLTRIMQIFDVYAQFLAYPTQAQWRFLHLHFHR